jgi:hypothetical protein
MLGEAMETELIHKEMGPLWKKKETLEIYRQRLQCELAQLEAKLERAQTAFVRIFNRLLSACISMI